MNIPALVRILAVSRSREGEEVIQSCLQGLRLVGLKIDPHFLNHRAALMPGTLEQTSCVILEIDANPAIPEVVRADESGFLNAEVPHLLIIHDLKVLGLPHVKNAKRKCAAVISTVEPEETDAERSARFENYVGPIVYLTPERRADVNLHFVVQDVILSAATKKIRQRLDELDVIKCDQQNAILRALEKSTPAGWRNEALAV
jgi:hypothetical protein